MWLVVQRKSVGPGVRLDVPREIALRGWVSDCGATGKAGRPAVLPPGALQGVDDGVEDRAQAIAFAAGASSG